MADRSTMQPAATPISRTNPAAMARQPARQVDRGYSDSFCERAGANQKAPAELARAFHSSIFRLVTAAVVRRAALRFFVLRFVAVLTLLVLPVVALGRRVLVPDRAAARVIVLDLGCAGGLRVTSR